MFNDLHSAFHRFAAAHRGHGGHPRHRRDHAFWGPGGHGTPGGRKLSSGDLQLVVLALLETKPSHGYELIRAIEERSGGFYVPSPGVIYPALTYLDEIGHAAVEPEGNRKLYRITEAGRAHLAANRAVADAILEALGRVGARMEGVREAFAGMDDLDPVSADELHRARHDLKHALRRERGMSPAEARRVAGILRRATAEILSR